MKLLEILPNIQIIPVGNSIRGLERLQKTYGSGRWRKLKGFGTICEAEFHWYEAHSIGKKEIKIKRFL